MKYETQEHNPMRITSLNHISIGCRSVEESVYFYTNVLGFVQIKRPRSFDFDGAWLYNYCFGIHLIKQEDTANVPKTRNINPKDNHISFQCESMEVVEAKLKQMEINYIKGRVEEGCIQVDQVFFHDLDGTMIEICNCNLLPIDPLVASDRTPKTCPCMTLAGIESPKQQQQQAYTTMTRIPSSVLISS